MRIAARASNGSGPIGCQAAAEVLQEFASMRSGEGFDRFIRL